MIYRRNDEGFNNKPLLTKKGEIVKSKGEKEIADLLWKLDIPYDYEHEFMGVRSDFTVYAPDGKVIIWEFIGPGMINHDDYFLKLQCKIKLYQYLNPYIYRVIFSNDSTPNEEIINQWVMQPRQEIFLTNIPEIFVNNLRKSINKSKSHQVSIKISNGLTQKTSENLVIPTSPCHNQEYWVIDSSCLSYFSCGDDESWHNATVFRNSMASIKLFSETENITMIFDEAWRIMPDETPILCWLDLKNNSFRKYNRHVWSEEESHEIAGKLGKRFNIKDRKNMPEIIFNIIASRPYHRSQIRILVNTDEMEYTSLNKPYQHLKSVEQRAVRLRQSQEQEINPRRNRRTQGENKILDFQILFDDDADYVDIFSLAGIDVETHLRETVVRQRSYCPEAKTWILKPRGRENRQRRSPRNNLINRGVNLGDLTSGKEGSSDDSISVSFKEVFQIIDQVRQRATNAPKDKRLQGRRTTTQKASDDLALQVKKALADKTDLEQNHAKQCRKDLIKELKSLVEPYSVLVKLLEADLNRTLRVQDFDRNIEELKTLRQYYTLRVKQQPKAK